MESYIRINTELRKKAASDFEKDLYKLMNNSLEIMENLRKRVDVKLVRSLKVERRVRRASNRRVCWPAPKMYSILEVGGKNTKKVKGVKKKKLIRHEQYKEALFENQTFRHGMDVLRSERHRIYGQYMSKVSLTPFDSKRWIAKNGVDTQAYGHRDVVCRWLVGCFGFNGLLRQISVYIGPFLKKKEKKRRERIDESKNVQTTSPAPTASAVGPCPTVIQMVGRPGNGVYPAPSHHPTTPHVGCQAGAGIDAYMKNCLTPEDPIRW